MFSCPHSIKFLPLYTITFHAICLKYIRILFVPFLSVSLVHSLLLTSGAPAYQKREIEKELRDMYKEGGSRHSFLKDVGSFFLASALSPLRQQLLHTNSLCEKLPSPRATDEVCVSSTASEDHGLSPIHDLHTRYLWTSFSNYPLYLSSSPGTDSSVQSGNLIPGMAAACRWCVE